MSSLKDWTQQNFRSYPNSIAYEYVLGSKSLGKFCSVIELKSKYPQAVDDGDDSAAESDKKVRFSPRDKLTCVHRMCACSYWRKKARVNEHYRLEAWHKIRNKLL